MAKLIKKVEKVAEFTVKVTTKEVALIVKGLGEMSDGYELFEFFDKLKGE